LTQDTLYAEGMPRLVELIEQAEAEGSPIAGEAGAALSQLNALEREVPDFFSAPALRAPTPRLTDSMAETYQRMFDESRLRPEFAGAVAWHTTRIVKGRARYEEVEQATGVPWYVIAVIHALEASFNFHGHLHNGDPLSARTVHVPPKRPAEWLPPADWKSSAIDALQGMNFAGASSWSLAKTLYRLERYNGFGYLNKGINSPYLWSFSDMYSKGKFVADRRFDPEAVSRQCGAAVMIKLLAKTKVINL
jgi:lysozyme family protein